MTLGLWMKLFFVLILWIGEGILWMVENIQDLYFSLSNNRASSCNLLSAYYADTFYLYRNNIFQENQLVNQLSAYCCSQKYGLLHSLDLHYANSILLFLDSYPNLHREVALGSLWSYFEFFIRYKVPVKIFCCFRWGIIVWRRYFGLVVHLLSISEGIFRASRLSKATVWSVVNSTHIILFVLGWVIMFLVWYWIFGMLVKGRLWIRIILRRRRIGSRIFF